MILKIEKDHQRFRQIVKGRIRDDLRKFLTKGELIGKEGKHLISIPVRGIELPHFRYGDNSSGVGAGDGKEGQVVGKGAGDTGGTEAGSGTGAELGCSRSGTEPRAVMGAFGEPVLLRRR